MGSPEGLVIRRAVPDAVKWLASARASDGRWFVVSCGSRTVRCWPAGTADIEDAATLVCDAAKAPLMSLGLAFLPGGTDVVVARGTDDRLHRWEIASWRPLGAEVRDPLLYFPPSGRPLMAVTGSAGEPAAVANLSGGGLGRWDIATGERIGDVLGEEYGVVLALHAGAVPGLGPVVVSASGDGLISRWDPVSGTEIGEPVRSRGLMTAIVIVTLPGGPTVCALGHDGRMYRHDLLTGEPLGEPVETGWQPGRNGIPCLGLLAAVPGTGDGVVAVSADRRSVQLWDLASGLPAGELVVLAARLGDLAVAQLPDGSPLIVTGHFDGQLLRFDARTGRPVGRSAEPHGTTAPQVVPVAAGGRDILIAHGRDTIRLLDRRTGELLSGTWDTVGRRIAVAGQPAGGLMLAAAGLRELVRYDWPSGASRRLAAPDDLSDIAAATLADGRIVIAGAGWDGNVYRLDAATGELIGRPLPGTSSHAVDLAVIDLPGGRQLLAGLDRHALYRWDPLTGESPSPAPLGEEGRFAAVHAGQDGIPVAFIHFPDEYDDLEEGRRVERWRLDKLTRVKPDPPVTLRAVFDEAGATWMILSELDGSLRIRPLPPILVEEPALEGLW